MTEPTVEPSGASIDAADPGPAADNQGDGEKPGLFEADHRGTAQAYVGFAAEVMEFVNRKEGANA